MSSATARSSRAQRLLELPLVRSRIVQQVALFTFSNGLVGLLGAVSKALLARVLSVASFGAFAFATSLLQFLALIFEFGLFVPASRLVAKSRDDSQRRELIGGALAAYLPIGIAFGVVMFGFSYAVDPLFQVDAGDALRIAAPFAIVYPFALIGLQLAQGADRLHAYSVTGALTQVLFVVVLVVVVAADWGLTAGSALVLRGAALAAGAIALVLWLRPVFRGATRHIPELIAQAREWGFKIYVGRVLSVGTYNLDVVILGALTDAKSVGFYTLAGAVAYALGLPVIGLASATFPRMARGEALRLPWLVLAWLSGIAAILLAWLVAEPLIKVVFGSSYSAAAALVVPLTLAQTVRGVTSMYNSYFSAHARGTELRNASIVLTVSNVAFNFLLIPPFGAKGAAWASVLALVANLVAHIVGYRRIRDGDDGSPSPAAGGRTTDFEAFGLAEGRAEVAGRPWPLTIDFEAFEAEHVDRWCHAVRVWAREAERSGLRFDVFLSVEDAVRLRVESPEAYARLLGALAELAGSGCEIHPHNHCVFDEETGVRPSEDSGWPQQVPGYAKRSSLYYDVVHRNGIPIGEWLPRVTRSYERVLADGGIARPERLAFRAGGWDHGAGEEECAAFVSALAASGYAVDSSATAGEFRTASWQVGAPFGRNAFWLRGGVLELAPCWSIDCGVPRWSRNALGQWNEVARQGRLWALPRRSGAAVTVLHFDHLFHTHEGGGREMFALADDAAVEERIVRFFAHLARVRRALTLTPALLSDVEARPAQRDGKPR